jgi:hypothetical protein
MAAEARTVTVKRTDSKPTVPQVYKIARELCRIAGVTFPETRADASAIISTLLEQSAAVTADAASADVPF